jgi:hypothetical protein
VNNILYSLTTGIICHDGDVRLVNGSGPHEGRIELCFSERWGTICDYDYSWNIQANVICQQLGYSGAGIIIIVFVLLHSYLMCAIIILCITVIDRITFSFGRGSLPVLVKYVYCKGYESNIGECTYSTSGLSDCPHYRRDIVGVHCISST